MSTLKKLVNIYPSMPITDFNPPMRVPVKRVYRSIGDIRTCLIRRAIVDEIMPDGSTIRLGLDNYNKVLNPIVKEEKEEDPVNNTVAPTNTEEEVKADETVETTEPVDADKAVWQAAYDEALADVDLSSMTNKQRKAAKASARAAADEAVAKLSEVENATAEVVEDAVAETEPVAEEVVETADAEDLTSVIE